jgi:hypothetical protein
MRELRAAVAALPGGGVQRRRAAVDLVRSAYGGPLFVAWVRLWVAAGEDAALRERIRPLERRVRQLMRELAADAMPDLAAAPGFGARLAVMATTLNGLGLWAHFEPRSTDHRGDPWPAHRAVIELILTAPAESLDIKHETSA